MKSVKKGRNVKISSKLNEQSRIKDRDEEHVLRKTDKSIKSKKRVISIKGIALLFVIIIIIILAFMTVFNKKSKDSDGLIHNRNKTFIKQQKISGVIFKDIDCTYDGKNSLITYKIVNSTSSKIFLNNYDIVVRDKENHQLTKIVVNSFQYFEPNKETVMANSVIGVDLSDAHHMELKLKLGEK